MPRQTMRRPICGPFQRTAADCRPRAPASVSASASASAAKPDAPLRSGTSPHRAAPGSSGHRHVQVDGDDADARNNNAAAAAVTATVGALVAALGAAPSAALRALRAPLADGLHLGEHMLAGAGATLVAVAVMHPLDTVKTLVQAAAAAPARRGAAATLAAAAGGGGSGSGGGTALAAVREGLGAAGPAALYRGLAPSVTGQVPAGAVKLAAFEAASQWARRRFPDAHPAATELASAALAFVACSVLLVPGEVLKQRLQAGQYPGVAAAVRGILAREGPRGFYAGYRATLMRDVPYTMLEFGLFAQFKRVSRLVARRQALTAQEEWTMGGFAGACTGFLTTPLDLAKTKLMTQPGPARAVAAAVSVAAIGSRGSAPAASASAAAGSTPMYTGVLDVFAKVAKKEGVRGLFRGAGPRVVWLMPFTALFFGVHSMTKRVLLERKARKQQRGTLLSATKHKSRSRLTGRHSKQ